MEFDELGNLVHDVEGTIPGEPNYFGRRANDKSNCYKFLFDSIPFIPLIHESQWGGTVPTTGFTAIFTYTVPKHKVARLQRIGGSDNSGDYSDMKFRIAKNGDRVSTISDISGHPHGKLFPPSDMMELDLWFKPGDEITVEVMDSGAGLIGERAITTLIQGRLYNNEIC